MLRPIRLPALLLALSTPLFAATPRFPAQEAQAAQAAPTADEAAILDLAKDHERILTLTSGSLLRTRAKFEDGQWHLRQKGTWYPLPAGSVAEAHTVKQLKKDAKKRERKLKLSDPNQRAELAFWLAENGLYNEALEHLDINLRKDPDHQPTLAIIGRGLVPVRLSAYIPKSAPAPDAGAETWTESTRALFDKLGLLSPATREVAWQQVRPLFADPEHLPAFLAATTEILSDHSSARRRIAASALQRLATDPLKEDSPVAQAAVKSLINRAALDGNDDVREAAARTLRDLNEPGVTAPFVKALASSSSAVRANSAEALGIIGMPAAAPAIVAALATTNAAGGSVTRAPASYLFVGRQIAYIQDFDVEAFAGAVAADPQVNVLTEGAVLDVRVLSITSHQARVHERSTMRGALGKLLGQDFHYDTDKWSKWIAEHPLAH